MALKVSFPVLFNPTPYVVCPACGEQVTVAIRVLLERLPYAKTTREYQTSVSVDTAAFVTHIRSKHPNIDPDD